MSNRYRKGQKLRARDVNAALQSADQQQVPARGKVDADAFVSAQPTRIVSEVEVTATVAVPAYSVFSATAGAAWSPKPKVTHATDPRGGWYTNDGYALQAGSDGVARPLRPGDVLLARYGGDGGTRCQPLPSGALGGNSRGDFVALQDPDEDTGLSWVRYVPRGLRADTDEDNFGCGGRCKWEPDGSGGWTLVVDECVGGESSCKCVTPPFASETGGPCVFTKCLGVELAGDCDDLDPGLCPPCEGAAPDPVYITIPAGHWAESGGDQPAWCTEAEGEFELPFQGGEEDHCRWQYDFPVPGPGGSNVLDWGSLSFTIWRESGSIWLLVVLQTYGYTMTWALELIDDGSPLDCAFDCVDIPLRGANGNSPTCMWDCIFNNDQTPVGDEAPVTLSSAPGCSGSTAPPKDCDGEDTTEEPTTCEGTCNYESADGGAEEVRGWTLISDDCPEGCDCGDPPPPEALPAGIWFTSRDCVIIEEPTTEEPTTEEPTTEEPTTEEPTTEEPTTEEPTTEEPTTDEWNEEPDCNGLCKWQWVGEWLSMTGDPEWDCDVGGNCDCEEPAWTGAADEIAYTPCHPPGSPVNACTAWNCSWIGTSGGGWEKISAAYVCPAPCVCPEPSRPSGFIGELAFSGCDEA